MHREHLRANEAWKAEGESQGKDNQKRCLRLVMPRPSRHPREKKFGFSSVKNDALQQGDDVVAQRKWMVVRVKAENWLGITVLLM